MALHEIHWDPTTRGLRLVANHEMGPDSPCGWIGEEVDDVEALAAAFLAAGGSLHGWHDITEVVEADGPTVVLWARTWGACSNTKGTRHGDTSNPNRWLRIPGRHLLPRVHYRDHDCTRRRIPRRPRHAARNGPRPVRRRYGYRPVRRGHLRHERVPQSRVRIPHLRPKRYVWLLSPADPLTKVPHQQSLVWSLDAHKPCADGKERTMIARIAEKLAGNAVTPPVMTAIAERIMVALGEAA